MKSVIINENYIISDAAIVVNSLPRCPSCTGYFLMAMTRVFSSEMLFWWKYLFMYLMLPTHTSLAYQKRWYTSWVSSMISNEKQSFIHLLRL